MSDYRRFAIYYLPDDPALARFGANWLGWDVVEGKSVGQPLIDPLGAEITQVTETPRKYGFHGTLKPPFRLAMGQSRSDLERAIERLAATCAPVRVDGLKLAQIGSFMALVCDGYTAALANLAARLVQELDKFRAPAPPEELARRRAAKLTPAQDALLERWGYPYVLEEFRFHLTLTGKVSPAQTKQVLAVLDQLMPDLPRPFTFASVALVGERADGRFEELHRYALSG